MNKADLEEKQERRMRYGFLALLLLYIRVWGRKRYGNIFVYRVV